MTYVLLDLSHLFGEFFLPDCYRKCPSKQPELSKIKSISRSFQLWLALFSVWFKSHLNDLELEYIFLALFRRHESFAAVCCRWCVRSGWIIATVWDKAGYRSIAFTRIRFSLFDKQKNQEVGNSLKQYPGIQHIVSEFYVFWKKASVWCVLGLDKYLLLMTGHARSSTQRDNSPAKKNEKSSFFVLNLTEKEKLVFVPLQHLCAIQFCGMALLKEGML